MVHGDDSGLVLPPRIAPTQVVVIPIRQDAPGVMDAAVALRDALEKAGIRVSLDDSDRSPGYKFSEQEMRGFPVRIELGPKDIEASSCVFVRRDTREKETCSLAAAPEKAAELLERIQKDMLDRAEKHLEEHTFTASTPEEFDECFKETKGFVKAMWCGDTECELKIKDKYGVSSRCIPFEQENIGSTCICCGKPASKMVIWGRAY